MAAVPSNATRNDGMVQARRKNNIRENCGLGIGNSNSGSDDTAYAESDNPV
jgi:hypothetical protein